MQYALTADGCRDAWHDEVIWLDQHVGVVVRDGMVVAAVVPLPMLRKIRAELSEYEQMGLGPGGPGPSNGVGLGTGPGTGPGPNTGGPGGADGPFTDHFTTAFETVTAAMRPDLLEKLEAAKARSLEAVS